MTKKIFVVKQQSISDCGPCALQSIILYYGGYVKLEKIREDCYATNAGCNVYDLLCASKKYGFDAVAKKDFGNELYQTKLPAIVHVHYPNGLQHFMCLYEINHDYVILMDPAKGKVKMKTKEFLNIYSNVKIELFPKNQIVLLEKGTNIYDLYFKIIKSNKKLSFLVFLTSVLLIIFSIISSLYFKYQAGYIENNIDVSMLKYIVYLFLAATIFKVLFDYLKKYYENHLTKNIDCNIFKSFITHIFNLPLKVVETHKTGEIVSRFSEINSIKELFSQIFVSSFLEIIMLFCSLIILFSINAKLSIVLVATVGMYVLVSIFTNTYVYKRINKNIDIQTEANSFLIENIDMLGSIKSLSKNSKVTDALEEKIATLIYDNFNFNEFYNFIVFIKDLILEIGIFIVNTYGFYLIRKNSISLVDLFTFNSVMIYLINPIKNMMEIALKYNYFKASFNKVCNFLDIEEEKENENEPFINGSITFDNICFSYNSYLNILENFCLTINQYDKVLIKGLSGCGKSTICQLLNRCYEPNSGRIYINGKNIQDYSIKTIRNNITYVGQKEAVYTDTIKNNICFYENFDNMKYQKVVETCMLEDIVSKKAFRYETGIDNNSSNLSGGEKQRIILARALYKNSQILILDEALSEVDKLVEEKIIKNIQKNYQNITLIYITHKDQEKLFRRIIKLERVKHEL